MGRSAIFVLLSFLFLSVPFATTFAADAPVRQIQKQLKRLGYDPGAIDGQAGMKTRQAVRRFQRAQGLPSTGKFDEATVNALGVDRNGTKQSGHGLGAGAGDIAALYQGSYALVVGNGAYTKGWSPLAGAVSDARQVAAALERIGFSVTLKTDLTKEGFLRVFTEFNYRWGRNEKNRILFYYAGHGFTEKLATGEDLGYLVMVDAPLPSRSATGFYLGSVDMAALITQAKKIRALHVLFMFDSCFSGSILNLRNEVVPARISDSVRFPVRQFITAGRASEPVPDQSYFKEAFLSLLDGRAPEPVPDGYLTGEEIGFYLKNKIPEYNPAQHPQYGKIRDPKLDKGDFVFALATGHPHPLLQRPESTAPLFDRDKKLERALRSRARTHLYGPPIRYEAVVFEADHFELTPVRGRRVRGRYADLARFEMEKRTAKKESGQEGDVFRLKCYTAKGEYIYGFTMDSEKKAIALRDILRHLGGRSMEEKRLKEVLNPQLLGFDSRKEAIAVLKQLANLETDKEAIIVTSELIADKTENGGKAFFGKTYFRSLRHMMSGQFGVSNDKDDEKRLVNMCILRDPQNDRSLNCFVFRTEASARNFQSALEYLRDY